MKKSLSIILSIMFVILCMAGCTTKSELHADEPVTLTMWHVYGEQADSPMNRLIDEFNKTIGKEKGIVIDVTMMSNSSQIGGKLLEAQADLPGAPEMPDLSDTKIEVSKIARPGMMFSGSATFANGATAEWFLDNMGRLGLDNLQGENPSEEDVRKFQMALQLELRKLMGR